MAGEGVELAAILGDGLREKIAGHRLGTPEHHMLEEMRDARDAGRIVHATDPKPQHLSHNRRTMIGDHQHLHAVLQGELESVVTGLARIDRRQRRQFAAVLRLRQSREGRGGNQTGGGKGRESRTSQTSRRSLLF